MIADYAWRGGREAMLRLGQPDWPTILIFPPLFEEANRTRAVLVGLMRSLAQDFEIASVLPDLPGTNDSPVATVDARFEDWAEAVAMLSTTLPRPHLTVSVRSGALLDQFVDADARWRLAPETGTRILRDMVRASAISSNEKPGAVAGRAQEHATMLGGNLLHPALYAALDQATPDQGDDVRTIQIDDGGGDGAIEGTPIWRGAEPQQDQRLVAAMAEDIGHWVNRCVAR